MIWLGFRRPVPPNPTQVAGLSAGVAGLAKVPGGWSGAEVPTRHLASAIPSDPCWLLCPAPSAGLSARALTGAVAAG